MKIVYGIVSGLALIGVVLGLFVTYDVFHYADTPQAELKQKMNTLNQTKNDTIIVFHKTGCKDCKKTVPMINVALMKKQFSDAKFDTLTIDTANTDNNKYVKDFKIQYVPTVIRVHDGKEVTRYTGTLNRHIEGVIEGS